MTERLRKPYVQHVALVDIDDTMVPTLEVMADKIHKEGRFTREQVLAAPLGRNLHPELHREQLRLIRNPEFLGGLQPLSDAIQALSMLAEHSIPYIVWSSRTVQPAEACQATRYWINETFNPPPIKVLLKAESAMGGDLFKAVMLLGIRAGSFNITERIIVPVVAFDNDSVVVNGLSSQGLHTSLIGSEQDMNGISPSAYLHGPYQSLKTAVTDFLYQWESGDWPKPNYVRRKGKTILRNMINFLVKEGTFDNLTEVTGAL